MFCSNHSGKPERHRSKAPPARFAPVDGRVAAARPLGGGHEDRVAAHRDRPRVRGLEPLRANGPRLTPVGARREPDGTGREHHALCGRDLVHVGVDVDRGGPRRSPVVASQDAAHVDVHVDVDVPVRHRTRVGRAAPRRVPRRRGLPRRRTRERARAGRPRAGTAAPPTCRRGRRHGCRRRTLLAGPRDRPRAANSSRSPATAPPRRRWPTRRRRPDRAPSPPDPAAPHRRSSRRRRT